MAASATLPAPGETIDSRPCSTRVSTVPQRPAGLRLRQHRGRARDLPRPRAPAHAPRAPAAVRCRASRCAWSTTTAPSGERGRCSCAAARPAPTPSRRATWGATPVESFRDADGWLLRATSPRGTRTASTSSTGEGHGHLGRREHPGGGRGGHRLASGSGRGGGHGSPTSASASAWSPGSSRARAPRRRGGDRRATVRPAPPSYMKPSRVRSSTRSRVRPTGKVLKRTLGQTTSPQPERGRQHHEPRRDRRDHIHTHAKIPMHGPEDPLTKAQRLEARKMFKTDIDTAVTVADVAGLLPRAPHGGRRLRRRQRGGHRRGPGLERGGRRLRRGQFGRADPVREHRPLEGARRAPARRGG